MQGYIDEFREGLERLAGKIHTGGTTTLEGCPERRGPVRA